MNSHRLKMPPIWIFVLTTTLLSFANCESSRFIVLPQSQSIVEGDPVTFQCNAAPSEGFQYAWTHNGQAIRPNDARIYQIGGDLHIGAVRRHADEGAYVCIIVSTASGARQASPSAQLSVIWIQTAAVQLLMMSSSETQRQAILRCRVVGSAGGSDGQYEIEWYRNSEKLSSLANIELKRDLLIVHQPTVADNGLYRCMAANAAGRVMSTRDYILKLPMVGCMPLRRITVADESNVMDNMILCRGKRGDAGGATADISIAPEAQVATILIIKEGEAVDLHCRYTLSDKYRQIGGASVQLAWRKDGKVLRQLELLRSGTTTAEPNKELLQLENSRIALTAPSGTLTLSAVVAGDEGHYNCQLLVEGRDSAIDGPVYDLQIVEQLKFMPQPPTTKNLELGTLAKIHCKAQGTPPPQIRWLESTTNDLSATVEDINGTLTFRNVSSEQRGNYTCIAANSQGQIIATVIVNVVVAPKFIVAPAGQIEAAETDMIAMHCQAIGDPKPTIRWDKDLEYLSENNTDKARFRFLENGTLEIHDIQSDDEGRYGCTIGSSAGLKREEVRLLVKSAESTLSAASGEETGNDGFLITRAVLITMSVAFAYIILVVGLMIWCRFRRQARKARLNENNKDIAESGDAGCAIKGGTADEQEPCLPPNGNSEKKHTSGRANRQANGHSNLRGGSGNEAQKSDDTACSNHSKSSKRSQHTYDQLALARASITELIHIGRGEFGDVFVGKIKAAVVRQIEESAKDAGTEKHTASDGVSASIEGGGALTTTAEKRRSKTSMDDIEEIKEEQDGTDGKQNIGESQKLVLVKALNKVKDEQVCQEFRRQVEMLRAITHKGVVRLYGLCREKDPHYMVLEQTDWGDLKQFLLATAGKVNTSTNSSTPPPLKTGQILAVAYQIARGMDAIYRARFIHKDLAARNCIISSDFIVKVSYPALCRDKYSKEYFKHRNLLLPVRWLAPECLPEDEYTTKSDIYAFGVVVWELFQQAMRLPFEELSNEEIVQRSQAGKLDWCCAPGTPDCLKETLMACWHVNPKERPSFSVICSTLSKAMQNGDK